MRRLLAIAAHGSQSFVDSLIRAWDDGDAVFPVDPRLPDAARERLLAAARLDEPVEEGDALVVATSGSSGEPKLAVLTHDAVAASAHATSARLGVDALDDEWLACLPLAHIGGLSVVTRAVLSGMALHVQDGFDPAAVEQAAHDGATLVALVPTALRRTRPELFRTVVIGGSAMPPNLPPNAVATYGMTETGSGIVYDGWPLDDVELEVRDGEIYVRAPMLLRAYRDGTDPKTADGWFATGDEGELGTSGRLMVHGRRGDVIVTGGENVWPVTVERALESHPAVAEVAVIGRPDPEWGMRVVALVVHQITATPPSLDDLRSHVKATLPAYCAPREVELVATLPRTPLGKLRRAELS